MKKLVYLLTLLFCFSGCQKQEVLERIEVTRVSFLNNSQLKSLPTITYENKKYNPLDQITTIYGSNKVQIYDSNSGEKLIDTVLNITGPQEFYIYQPFDIIPPVITDKLPDIPPIDPRNPLKNEPPAPEGYFKLKMAFKPASIFLDQKIDMVILSKTVESPNVEVPIETLHGISSTYNTALFLIKRPELADGSRSQNFSFGFIDPVTGAVMKNTRGDVFRGGPITLPIGTRNIYMYDFEDAETTFSRYFPTALPIDGKYYLLRPTLLWSIE